MGRPRPDPSTPSARRQLSELHFKRKIKLKKQLSKAQAKLGLSQDLSFPKVPTAKALDIPDPEQGSICLKPSTRETDHEKSNLPKGKKSLKSTLKTKDANTDATDRKGGLKDYPGRLRSDPLAKSLSVREKLLEDRRKAIEERNLSEKAARLKKDAYNRERQLSKKQLGKRTKSGQLRLSNHVDFLLAKIQKGL
jgi:hypothetical protein